MVKHIDIQNYKKPWHEGHTTFGVFGKESSSHDQIWNIDPPYIRHLYDNRSLVVKEKKHLHGHGVGVSVVLDNQNYIKWKF